MKKTIVVLLILMNVVSVDASSNNPKYKIIIYPTGTYIQ